MEIITCECGGHVVSKMIMEIITCECGGHVVSKMLWPTYWKEECERCGGYILIKRSSRDWENDPLPERITIQHGVHNDKAF